ncbi:hypothetical protein OS121_28875 [Mycolicibacterium mucogenicum]|uniref:hypothetical protein n=1 Tax=Mycolicibacterium mucogenicum TaxID=56689 RepID=UPI002269E753|nr:hypothetical protein [Mycolicibacterium mucogenicum]MCX8559059.1 hypothetical protein [Mycolicibacterium mucogenicum]
MVGRTVSALMRAEITEVLVAHPRPMSTTEIAQRIVGRGQAQPRTAGYFAGDIYPYLRQLESAGEVVRTRRHDGSVCVYWALTSGPDSAWAEAVAVTGVVDLDMPAGAVIGGADLGSDALDVSNPSAVDEEAALRALLEVRNRQIKALKAQVAEHNRTIAILHGEIARRSRQDPGGPQFTVQDLDR